MPNDLDIIVQLEEKIHQLPPHLISEADDFISFLLQKYQITYASNSSVVESSQIHLESESFVGMWHNRDDMADSSTWVRNLRLIEWN
jgi:hypothetical protein